MPQGQSHRIKKSQKQRQRSSLLVRGRNRFNSYRTRERFTCTKPDHTLPKWMSFQTFFLTSFKHAPQPAATTFVYPSVRFLFYGQSLPWLVHQTSHVVTQMIVTLYNRCNTRLMFTLLYKCPINVFYNVTLVLLIVNDFNYFYIYLFV